MKRLKDYVDPAMCSENYFPIGMIGNGWASILTERLTEIGMNDVEFYAFVRFFIYQLPHDWDGKEFMKVKIIRTND